MADVFIIGSKGIPANYGGFETFVQKLVENTLTPEIKYHVACMADEDSEFEFLQARCFNVKVPHVGSARAVLCDLKGLDGCLRYIEEHHLEGSIIYILACRIGPFMRFFQQRIKRLKVKVYVNPDGHEWKRSKWNYWIKKYWKLSERLMVKHAELLVCDSRKIEEYIHEEYGKYAPVTSYISYGAELTSSVLTDEAAELLSWYKKHQITKNSYYLIVGRFVPENNFETMIKEFMQSETKRDLVIVTNYSQSRFSESLLEKLQHDQDQRIKFVGTVYEQELIKKIRENAFAYIHGHEVGGTNPSLLEALASTRLNILFDVPFNREVAEEAALYFTKEPGSLIKIIEQVEKFDDGQLVGLGNNARNRIEKDYSWEKIVAQYQEIFLSRK